MKMFLAALKGLLSCLRGERVSSYEVEYRLIELMKPYVRHYGFDAQYLSDAVTNRLSWSYQLREVQTTVPSMVWERIINEATEKWNANDWTFDISKAIDWAEAEVLAAAALWKRTA